MNKTRLISTLLAAAAISGAAAGTASADSVAYVKGGNVYLTPGDLSREFQVTATGGFSAVSQADDGTLLATKGGDLIRLDRLGNVLSDIKTPVSDAANGLDQFYGPFNADISPDGKTAAYGYVHSGWTTDSDGNADFEQRNGTGFTKSDALTGFTDDGYKYSSDWDGPEFIDNQTVFVTNGPGWPSDPFAYETVGSGDPQGWFTDPNNMHPLDGTVSRNKRLIAAVAGPDRQKLMVYRDDDAQVGGGVHACFTYSDTGAYKFESPTFNANGTKLYWSDGNKLDWAPIGDMSSTCADGLAGGDSFQGATSPDWGPADVPAARPVTPTTTTTTTTTTTKTTPTVPNNPNDPNNNHHTAQLGLLAQPAAKLAKALKRGTSIPVSATGAGTITAKARNGKTIVASGTTHAKKAGRVVLHLTFTKAAKRRLKHRKHVTLTLTITQGNQHVAGRLKLS
jgi:hypothetical protein